MKNIFRFGKSLKYKKGDGAKYTWEGLGVRKRPGPGLSLVRPVHLGWLWARFRVTEAGVEAGLRARQEREVLSPGGDLLPPPPRKGFLW